MNPSQAIEELLEASLRKLAKGMLGCLVHPKVLAAVQEVTEDLNQINPHQRENVKFAFDWIRSLENQMQSEEN